MKEKEKPVTARQLAAILFADIAGYSSMMQKDENLAVATANHFRNDIEFLVPKHQGRIIQFYGDGCLIIFNSVVNAVHCTIAIHESFRQTPAVPARMGVHQGDIVMEGGNIFGNSVNIAARIESMSIPGAVLLSEKVCAELINHPDFEMVSLGHFLFKNIKRPLEVFALSNSGFSIPKRQEISGKFAAQNEEKSIAVLPFQNRSSDPEQAYFGDGIAEEIIYGLSQLENLKVVSRAASFALRNHLYSPAEIAQKLGAENILEGSVRKIGNKVRVSAQLVNGKDGFQIWTERFDRELQDIFAIQDEIAAIVVNKMKLSLLGKERHMPVITRKTNNVDAYQFYLRGRSYLDQRTNINAALTCFEQALILDPNFAAALTSIAYANFYKVVFNNYRPKKGFPKAEVAIRKALQLDPTIAEAHTMYGLVRFYYYHEWEEARQAYERAILLQPKLADTYRVKAYFHSMICEFEEAIKLAEEACNLEPQSFNNQFSLADILYRARKYDDSIATYHALLDQYPDNPMAKEMLARAYFHGGDPESAKSIFSEKKEMPKNAGIYTSGRFVFAIFNHNRDLAEKYLAYLKSDTHEWIHPCVISLMYFALGDQKNARQAFQRAIDEKDPGIIYLNVDPFWEPFKKDPIVRKSLDTLQLCKE